jgi:hypothetical protein
MKYVVIVINITLFEIMFCRVALENLTVSDVLALSLISQTVALYPF